MKVIQVKACNDCPAYSRIGKPIQSDEKTIADELRGNHPKHPDKCLIGNFPLPALRTITTPIPDTCPLRGTVLIVDDR
jgi:hypothetical protein